MTGPAQPSFVIDGLTIPYRPGESVLQAALAAGRYIPTLCYHPAFPAHGSCRVCVVQQGERIVPACATQAAPGLVITATSPVLSELRRDLVRMLFSEGNHVCPGCELSGRCQLQAVGYAVEMTTVHYHPLFPLRAVDASHPDVLLDFNRCILCELCVRASAEVDGKHVFALAGRGIDKRLIVNAESGRLADTPLALTDMALQVCPVGALLPKRRGFDVAIGERRYDQQTLADEAIAAAQSHRHER
jgi:[NiFe] hydrogenase diaphorase moiety small subunit